MSLTLSQFLRDLGERALKTFVQTLILFLAAGVSVTEVPWLTALGAAGLATLVTVLLAVSTATVVLPNAYVDILARAARTFAASLIGAIPVTTSAGVFFTFADVAWGQAAGIAATAALLSVVTSIVSLPVGPVKGSPSLVDATPFESLNVIHGEVRTAGPLDGDPTSA